MGSNTNQVYGLVDLAVREWLKLVIEYAKPHFVTGLSDLKAITSNDEAHAALSHLYALDFKNEVDGDVIWCVGTDSICKAKLAIESLLANDEKAAVNAASDIASIVVELWGYTSDAHRISQQVVCDLFGIIRLMHNQD